MTPISCPPGPLTLGELYQLLSVLISDHNQSLSMLTNIDRVRMSQDNSSIELVKSL